MVFFRRKTTEQLSKERAEAGKALKSETAVRAARDTAIKERKMVKTDIANIKKARFEKSRLVAFARGLGTGAARLGRGAFVVERKIEAAIKESKRQKVTHRTAIKKVKRQGVTKGEKSLIRERIKLERLRIKAEEARLTSLIKMRRTGRGRSRNRRSR